MHRYFTRMDLETMAKYIAKQIEIEPRWRRSPFVTRVPLDKFRQTVPPPPPPLSPSPTIMPVRDECKSLAVAPLIKVIFKFYFSLLWWWKKKKNTILWADVGKKKNCTYVSNYVRIVRVSLIPRDKNLRYKLYKLKFYLFVNWTRIGPNYCQTH